MKKRYLNITIGGQQVEVTNPEELPFSVSYSLEDPGNFQNKTSANAIGITIPATLRNDKVANQFHNIDAVDTSPNDSYRSNQKCVVEANGVEILTGKAFLEAGTHTVRPKDYKYNLYGDNADWLIDLQEKTLFDFLNHISFTFDKATITASWAYDGQSEDLPYVFAPVKYMRPMGDYTRNADGKAVANENNMKPEYLRPSVSVYWLLYWGFQSIGYRIQSDFFNTEYFRRAVIPWVWGNFLDSDGTRLNTHKFLAKGSKRVYNVVRAKKELVIWNLFVDNSSTDGAFDNNSEYSYNASTYAMQWQYKPPYYGILEANLALSIDIKAFVNQNSDFELRVQWFHNGVMFDSGWGGYSPDGNLIVSLGTNIGIATGRTFFEISEVFCTRVVQPGDIISAKIWKRTFESKYGDLELDAQVIEFKLDYFRIPPGGTIDFQNYTSLQKHKWVDFFRGIIDTFNLSLNTDSISKVVLIEPTHPYSLTNDLSIKQDGYFKNDFVRWDGKQDLSKDWSMENYSDYEREVTFKFKDDTNDGILKKIQDRHATRLAACKYVFPDRFKKGKKEVENRFFSPVMHYEVDQWKSITGEAPQLICIIPENISNTSNSEADNTFTPKLAHYKGVVAGVGGWKFDGETKYDLPYLFAVNYKDGGENDPVLSYGDEKIKSGGGFVTGKGLLRRFFLQRLAVMRNGQWYTAWLRLNDTDVTGFHREYKAMNGHRYELVQIKEYKPLLDESTGCLVRRWAAVEQRDSDNVFPSFDGVLGNPVTSSFETKYAPLKCLANDIPKP